MSSTSHLHLSKAIEQLLQELETKQPGQIDQSLCLEVRNALGIAEKDRSFVAAKTGFVLETILKSVYQQQFPNKPLPNLDAMIGALHKAKVLPLSLTRDADYIRLKRNDASHGKDTEQTFLSAREAEQLILITLNFVEWYFKSYTHGESSEAGTNDSTPFVLAPNPYRGLASFRIQDSELFFGREQETQELLSLTSKSFITIAGASGSGKSSLAFAGLAAGLQQQGWVILTCRPHKQPLYELAKTLAAALYPDSVARSEKVNVFKQKLAEQQLDLNDLLEQIRGEKPGVLLLIDQFEELFTQTDNSQLIQDYCHTLSQAVHGNPGQILYAVTLRADFFGQALQEPALAELLDRYPKKMLGPITDLRAVIEQPAKSAGAVFEKLLVERLLRDLQQSEQANANTPLVHLPLLQFTLARLWDAQENGQITHRAYGELEGVQQALSHRAETVYASLDAEDQARMRRILVQLIHPGQGTEDTRQLAYREQVADSDWPLVDVLAKERLVIASRDETSGKETVEIVHEALLRHWQRLRSWIDEDREFRLWQDKLRQYLNDWQSNGEDDEALLSGPRLAEAQANFELHQDRLAIVEAQFIEASIANVQREQEEERRRQQEINEALVAKAQASKRLAKRSIIFAVVASILVVSTSWLWLVTVVQQEKFTKVVTMKNQNNKLLIDWFLNETKEYEKNNSKKFDSSELKQFYDISSKIINNEVSNNDRSKIIDVGNAIVKISEDHDFNTKVLGLELLARINGKSVQKKELQESTMYYKEIVKIIDREYNRIPSDNDLREKLANNLGGLSFSLLKVGSFNEALQASNRAIDLEPDEIWLKTNKAHALLFLDIKHDAIQIYSKYKNDKAFENKTFKEATFEDFDIFQKLGLPDEKMQIVRKLYEE